MGRRLSVVAAWGVLSVSVCLAGEIKVGVFSKTYITGQAETRVTYSVDRVRKDLDSEPDIKAELFGIKELHGEKLYDYDVVICQGIFHADGLNPHFLSYVAKGFGVMLTYNSVGYKTYCQELFPEVWVSGRKIVGYTNSRGVYVVDKEHPVTQGLPEAFEHETHFDHICMRAQSGKVLAKDINGNAVLIAGQYGKGKVLACGMYMKGNHDPNEYKIFVNGVRWLAKDTPKDRSEPSKPLESEVQKLRSRLAAEDVWFIFNQARNEAETLLDRVHYRIERTSPFAKRRDTKKLEAAKARISTSRAGLQERFHKHRDEQMAVARQTGRTPDLIFYANSFDGEGEDRTEDAQEGTHALASAKTGRIFYTTFRGMPSGMQGVTTSIYAKSPDGAGFRVRGSTRGKRYVLLEVPKAGTEYTRHTKAQPFAASSYMRLEIEKLGTGTIMLDALQLEGGEKASLFGRPLYDAALFGLYKEAEQMASDTEQEIGKLLTKLEERKQKERAAAVKKEKKADKKAVPELIEKARAETRPWMRERYLLELGRIGHEDAEGLLIECLSASEYPVARAAMMGLGWMQSRKAVDRLMALAKGSPDVWKRRRAVQVLGIIGDPKPVLLLESLLDDADPVVRDNACYSLGWLRSSSSAEKIEAALNEKKIGELSAIIALGCIGDPEAMQRFKKQAEERTKKGARRDTLLATLNWAIRVGEAGKDAPPGIAQADYLSQRKYFYWTNRFRRGFARRNRHSYNLYDKLMYMRSAHATDQISFGFWSDPGVWKTAEEYDIRNCGTWNHKFMTYPKIYDWADRPAYLGCWWEEGFGGKYREPIDLLREQLKARYTPELLAGFGIKSPDDVVIPTPKIEDKKKRMFLCGEYLDVLNTLYTEWVQETTEWAKCARKGFSVCVDQTGSLCWGSVGCAYMYYGRILDSAGIEPSYCTASLLNAFMCDLVRDGEARNCQLEVYAFRSLSPRDCQLGASIGMLHTNHFYWWCIDRVFKWDWRYPMCKRYEGLEWKPGRWEPVKQVFARMAKLEPYLIRVGTNSNVALLYSGRSGATRHHGKGIPAHYGNEHTKYFQNQVSVYHALKQSHVQLDSIWLETMTAEKLKKYQVLILSYAFMMTDEEIGLLRQWVKDGGVLIATGRTSIEDRWGFPQENYKLADVFGCNYKGRVIGVEDKYENKYVYAGVKPTEGLGKWKLTKATDLLPGLDEGASAEYFVKECGYDKVEPSAAEVLATWDDGSPAVLANQYGKGRCIFFTAATPGCCHIARQIVEFPALRDFYPGIPEFIHSAVQGGLAVTASPRPFKVENCPLAVEVELKCQYDDAGIFSYYPDTTQPPRRHVLHLLNYDLGQELVSGVRAAVRVPESKKLRVFYPFDDAEVEWRRDGDYVVFDVRDFGLHECVVIE